MANHTSRTKTGASRPAPSKPPFQRERVENWRDLQQLLDQYLTGEWLFRGVTSAKHLLIPSIGRGGSDWTYSRELERRLLDQFKREAVPLLPISIESGDDWTWLALAQHHGVPTRLLDWSESPLVSLFFAVWGEDLEDAGLYVSRRPPDVRRFEGGPLDVEATGFFYPSHVTPRITAQSGLFTVQPDPTEPYPSTTLHQIVISADAKPEVRRKLDALGFHDAFIYADLDGLCRRLRVRQSFVSVASGQASSSQVSPEQIPFRKPPPNDPQKYQWGGSPERNGWTLSANVSPDNNDDWFRIRLHVKGSGGKRLSGPVTFHLHDTFAKSVRECFPKAGGESVSLSLWSYGAFTVGALVAQDGTKLELDLAELEGAPLRFRSR